MYHNKNPKSNSNCPYCGDSPVNHTLAYISQSLSVYFDPILSKIAGGRNSFLSKFIKWVNRVYIFLANKMGILWFGKNINNAKTTRSKVIWQEANSRGIKMEQIIIYGKPIEQYRAKINNKWFYFESLPIPPYLPQDSYNFIDDKFLLKELLTKNNIPVPRSISVSNLKQALEIFHTFTGPIIIKPRVGSRGRHTTVYIKSEEEFIKAFKSAQVLCKYVVIEDYLAGPVCRATIVNGKLVGFFVAKAPIIMGDGHKNIKQLITEKNLLEASIPFEQMGKNQKVEDIIITDELLEFIERQGYKLDSVLESGKKLQLIHRTGRFFGGETEEFLPKIHPELKRIIEQAGRVVNVPVVGFDVIIENPQDDPNNQKWGIIEANSLPFIDLHYFPLYGEPINIAKYIWDLWE